MTSLRGLKQIAIGLSLMACFGALSSAQQYPDHMFQGMRWRMIGPHRGGRTRAVAGVASQPNVFYMGQVNGGVWKSDDYGRTWSPIFDQEATQSIGAIAVAPSDPNIIYVASGEGLQRPDLSVGDGIYKSTDGGKTWTHLGLRDGQQIPALAVDPRDPNRLFAAVLGHPYGANAERGIFRTTDGGENWQKVLYVDENTGGSDIEMDPTNPDVLYAGLWESRQGPWEYGNSYGGSSGGLYKSTDGGGHWQKLTKGLPKGVIQINIAIAPSNPHRLYATVASTLEGDYLSGHGLGIYRSDDSGETWTKATDDLRSALRIGGGDLPVPKIDPKNPDVVYVASIVTWRSTDAGKTWTGIRGAPGGDDYQNLWINPNDTNIILLVSDQGAIVTVNGGETWSSWYNQPTAQLYHAATTNEFPYKVCGGQQESGSVCVSSRGNDGEITFREWHPVGIIEYGYAAPDPLHPEIVYGAGTNNVSRFDFATGQVQNVTPIPLRSESNRVDRTQPIIFSPLDPHVLYYAANTIFKTTDGGHSWLTISPDLGREHPGVPASLGTLADKDPNAAKQRGVVYSLAPSFKSLGTLWAGTDDGYIWITRDGGKNWKNITPPELTPWSKVTQLAASHFDNFSAYASVSRFRIDDLHPYLYRTHDGGKTWQSISAGLPDDAPVDTVREDPLRKGLLYAGTEKSVWVSFDDGDHWQPLQLNLPHTSMRDLWIHDDDLIVATHGRSFWVLDDIARLRQIPEAAKSEAFLFKPSAAVRARRDTNTDTPIPPDEPTAENPPDGAVLDYFLAQNSNTPVTLEILDAGGKLVRRYSSADKPELSEDDLKRISVPLYWVRMPRTLSAEAGAHRWVWDLHYAPPDSLRYEYPISAIPHDTPREPLGPPAQPGRYTVRLTADGHTFTAPLTVKMDPRVKTPLVGLEEQFRLETRLASMMTETTGALRESRAVRDQLAKLKGQATGDVADSVQELEKKLTALLGAPGGFFGAVLKGVTLGKVSGETGTLYGDIGGADTAPTATQRAAVAQTERDFAQVMKGWNEIKKTDIPALNNQLRQANLPELRLEAPPQMGEEDSDNTQMDVD